MLLKLLLTSIYIVVFFLGYLLYMNGQFEYFGFLFYDKTIGWYIYTYVISMFPILFYRKGKLSSFLATIIYLTLYIPIIVFYTFFPEQVMNRHILVQMFCMLGMIMFFSISWIKFTKVYRLNISLLGRYSILIITVIMSLFLLFQFRNNIKFVNFDEVYDLRGENNVLSSGMVAYIILWLTYFFMPYLLAYGLTVRNKYYFLMGCIPGLIIYMTTGAKLALFMPFIMYGCYYIFRKNRINMLYESFVIGLIVLVALPLLLGVMYPDYEMLNWANSIVLVRTVGNGGMLTYWYDSFFLHHPHTYLSHVNIVNLITNMYPYNMSVGQVVGREYWSEGMNANANFWATDGIGGFGIYGIMLFNIIFTGILLLLDYLSSQVDQLFVLLLFVPFSSAFLNSSLFTAILSGGAVFSIMLLVGNKKNLPLSNK